MEFDWASLVPTALGGVLALAGGAVTQVLSLRSERQKRVHQRSEDAAKTILDSFTELVIMVRRTSIMDAMGGGDADMAFEGYLEDSYHRDYLTISAYAAVIEDIDTRQTLEGLIEAVSVSTQIARLQAQSEGTLDVAERLCAQGQVVAGAYLRGDGLRQLPSDVRRSIEQDLAAAKAARQPGDAN